MIRIPQGPFEERIYRLGLAGVGQADLIERELSVAPGKVPDVGCGPQGHHVANLAQLANFVVALDHDPRIVEAARADGPDATATFVVADASELPFWDGSFDHIVALGVLAYVRDVERLFREFARVLSGEGKLFASNSPSHPREPIVRAAESTGLELLTEDESYCPAASGDKKSRYLWIFRQCT